MQSNMDAICNPHFFITISASLILYRNNYLLKKLYHIYFTISIIRDHFLFKFFFNFLHLFCFVLYLFLLRNPIVKINKKVALDLCIPTKTMPRQKNISKNLSPILFFLVLLYRGSFKKGRAKETGDGSLSLRKMSIFNIDTVWNRVKSV